MMQAIPRRRFLHGLAALGAWSVLGPARATATGMTHGARIAAAWRGPQPDDPYFAGVFEADWQAKKLRIAQSVPLPTRPHGLLPEADGSLLVCGVRPGGWLLRMTPDGRIERQVSLADEAGDCRLNGHAMVSPGGELIYTTETDQKTGQGRIGVRDRLSLRKLDEWASHGREPHQLLVDAEGRLLVANGGIPRTASDKKYDLQLMDSSLVRLDGKSGALQRQWTVDDRRLSLRHLAWSRLPEGRMLLGVAIQAEHDSAAERNSAPILAVLDGDELRLPTRADDGAGYAGDICAAYNGGFALSNNRLGVAQLWHPGMPERLTPIVQLEEAYALSGWEGPDSGGVLVSTGLGLVGWQPRAKPVFLPWPKPMAVDNHWVVVSEA